MQKRIDTILNCFDTDTQRKLLDFCDRITGMQADVFILMARKAACFFNCLEEAGLIHFNGFVTSERILDLDTSWLKGKKIIIIDDAIVSGTSLYETIEKIEQSGAANIEVHVLTVNSKWFQPDMLINDSGQSYLYPEYEPRDDVKCISLCYNVVNAILLHPRPYDIDFPYYKSIMVNSLNFKHILNNFGWNCFNLSTYTQNQNDVFSITLLPTADTIDSFSRSINIALSKNCIVKLRIYGRVGDNKYHIRLVPMVVLNELSTESITLLFGAISENYDSSFAGYFITERAKLRFLQFYLADKLAKYWIEHNLKLINSDVSLYFEERNISFIFPETIVSSIKDICGKTIVFPVLNDNLSKRCTIALKTCISNYDYISTEAKLIEPFLEMYREKEIPCRELVIEKGRSIFANDEYHEIRNRLNEGVTVSDLEKRLEDCSDKYNVSEKVSLFIDRAIDFGIIVPVTQIKDGFVFRAYRHGEDVLFGKREEILYSEMLRYFQKKADRIKGITHLGTEKMIVLFSQIGVRKGLLQPYLGNFTINPKDKNGEICKILRVKTYLKGPVGIVAGKGTHRQTQYKPYITTENKSHWLTNLFIQKNYIKLGLDNLYYINEVDTSSIDDEDISTTQTFSILFGEVCNPNVDTGVTYDDNDLTKIATCLTMEDTVRAIAAEMNIFNADMQYTELNLRDQKTDDILLNDFKNSHMYESINSAYMKLNAYENKEALKLIKSVTFERETDLNTWRSFFKEALAASADKHSLNTSLNNLFISQKYWVMEIILAINILHSVLWLSYKANYKTKKYADLDKAVLNIRKYIGELKSMEHLERFPKECNKDLLITLGELVIEYAKSETEVKKEAIKKVLSIIELLQQEAENILDETCCIIGDRGKIKKLDSYNQGLCVVFSASNSVEMDKIQDTILWYYYKFRKEIDKTRHAYASEGVLADILPDIDMLPQKDYPEIELAERTNAIWFAAKGRSAGQLLARLALNLFYFVSQMSLVRILSVNNINYRYAIKSNDNIEKTYLCNAFYKMLETLPADMFKLKLEPSCIISIVEEDVAKYNRFTEYLKTKGSKHYQLVSTDNIVAVNSECGYICEKFEPLDKKVQKTTGGENIVQKDIGIITILDEETNAAIKQLGLKEEPFAMGKRLYYSGALIGDQVEHSVILTQQLSQGGVSASAAYNDMIQKYSPKIVVIMGIAGGITDNVDYCSVVIGNQIIGYDLQKDYPNGIQRRGDVNKIKSELIPLIQRFFHSLVDKNITSGEGSLKPNIHVIQSNIGSGSAVIENSLSEIKKWILNFNDKTDAVEMEAHGLGTAFYEDLTNRSPKYGICVIRGISDLADPNKARKTKYRIPAAENAAIVLKELVKVLPKL